MAWSERQVSRPDLSCRKLFMSLNKMMLQLPMMNNLCVCVCVCACVCVFACLCLQQKWFVNSIAVIEARGHQAEIPLTHKRCSHTYTRQW